MKRVLVTGGSGFIGRYCLPRLKKMGYEIYAITSKKIPSVLDGTHWIEFDFLKDSIQSLMQEIKPSHLLHLAWVSTLTKFWESKENLDWLKASIHLVESFVIEGGKRAVFAGTCAEYDWTSAEFLEYRTPCMPHTLYGSSKLSLYLLLQSLARQMGLSHAWGRIFYLYGPYEYPQRFIPTVIQGLLQKKKIPCSHCNQIKDFLHIEDVASAFISLLESEVQGAMNIGSGTGMKLNDIIDKIVDQLGGRELIQLGALSSPQNEPLSLVADTKRLKSELQWMPRYSFDEGLNQTIAWWQKYGL